jgi:hypothetical protein
MMKKAFSIATVILLVPFSVFAKSSITDGDLDSITGKSGISIFLDVRIDIHLDAIAWGDADGLNDGHTTGGWVGLKDLDATGIRVRQIPDISSPYAVLPTVQVLTVPGVKR